MNTERKIEIRPIPNRANIKQFSEDLEAFSQSRSIPALVNPKTRQYESGLTEEDIEYLESKECPYDISTQWIPNVPHPFWESQLAKVELKSTPVFLYPDRDVLDFIKWKFLLKSVLVYNSESEMNSGSKPRATHYLYDATEENSIKASKIDHRNNLIKQIDKLSLKRKRDFILIINNETTENKNEDYLTIKFDEILQSKEQTAILEELLIAKTEDVAIQATIKSAIQKNVLRKTREGIFFYETNIGFSEDDVKNFLGKKENQEILLNIQEKLN